MAGLGQGGAEQPVKDAEDRFHDAIFAGASWQCHGVKDPRHRGIAGRRRPASRPDYLAVCVRTGRMMNWLGASTRPAEMA